jgi:hypothetical protein
MSFKERILKDKSVLCIKSIMDLIRDGKLSTLTKLPRRDPRDLTVNTDSTSIDHSTSDQDSQCGELLKLFLTTLDSEDSTFQEEDNKLGSLTESRIPSSLNTLNPTPFTWLATAVIPTSESLLPAQDGGKCSE